MNIGLDFDDVIAHSQILKPRSAKELFGVEVEADDFTKEVLVANRVLTEAQFVQAATAVYRGKYSLPEVPYALHYIKKLLQDGHTARIVTNRSEEQQILQPALDWLAFKNLPLEVKGVLYGLPKAPHCEGLDIFVEDEVGNLEAMIGLVPHLLLLKWPHRRKPVPVGITVVQSWIEIYGYISNLKGG